MGSLRADIEVAVGDTTKDTQYFLSQGLTHSHVRNAQVAWIWLTESMSDTDLLDRVFARQSPSGAWKIPRDWFLPRSFATQVKRSGAFDAVQMEKGEEPMKCFSRCREDRKYSCFAWCAEIGRRCEPKIGKGTEG